MEFHELQQIVESNARAIQAMLDAQASSMAYARGVQRHDKRNDSTT